MSDGQIPAVISYYAHEAEIARSEMHAKRWMIAAVIAFLALLFTNAGWLYHESLYKDEVVSQEVTQTTDGGGNNTNNLYNGDHNGDADS